MNRPFVGTVGMAVATGPSGWDCGCGGGGGVLGRPAGIGRGARDPTAGKLSTERIAPHGKSMPYDFVFWFSG